MNKSHGAPHENPAVRADPAGPARYVLSAGGASVDSVAGALAVVFGALVRAEPFESTAEYLRSLAEPDVVLGVFGRGEQAWRIARDSRTPIVAVPSGFRCATIQRVLVPLDGTVEAAAAVAETAQLFRAADVEVIVLHVFDRRTVPAYWDQAAHERVAWEEEFLSRYCTPYFGSPGPALTLRNGVPAESVVEIADNEADLVILGWSQCMPPGHAEVVRRAMTDLAVPVLFIPMASK
ncbi:universal stress protein [Nocardia sp. CS682]|uniref:universal stress protein n=1 Tax=Nocardia sp. CS682 TaxID=1047172 RepID=UPI0014306886|nr:universal stress protein [Nocardia sp. CS682]